MDGVV